MKTAYEVRKSTEGLFSRNFTTLPLLDDGLALRPIEEIKGRMLAMHAVVACAYGFPMDRASAWLSQVNCFQCLTIEEQDFLKSCCEDKKLFCEKVEAVWALSWVLSLHDEFVWSELCADYLIELLPKIPENEGTEYLDEAVSLRGDADVFEALDRQYCMHWLLVENSVNTTFDFISPVPYDVVVNRRHALEWALSSEEWSSIQLDT